MQLVVYFSWDRKKRMDIIRLSLQTEVHGSGCTSLRNIFMGSYKKGRKPCRVSYSTDCVMKSYWLWDWLAIRTQNHDHSFVLKSPRIASVLDWCWQATWYTAYWIHKGKCIYYGQDYLNWWCTENTCITSLPWVSCITEETGREQRK